jgi:hypothetical protein
MKPPRPDLPEPPSGGRRGSPRGLPRSLWLKVLPAFGLAALVAILVPRTGDGPEPPVRTLLIAGLLIAGLTTVALYVGIRRDLKLPARVAAYFVAYNALIVLVKFVLAPKGFYEVNRTRSLQVLAGGGDVGFTLVLAGTLVFLLYAAVFALLYRAVRGRVVREPAEIQASKRRRRTTLGVVVAAIALAPVFGGFVLFVLAIGGGGLQYLDFVFTSSVSLLVAFVLACASGIVVMGFRSVEERDRVIGEASALVSLFWLGLGFLALYHILWLVYILVLSSVWPLKVVVPK